MTLSTQQKKALREEIDKIELAARPRVGRGHFASDSTRMRPVNISLPPDIVAKLSLVKEKSHLIERLLRFFFDLEDTQA